MRALAGFIMAGRLRAMLVAATGAMLALLAPPVTSPLSYLGGATVALVTLRRGATEGAIVLVGAALGTGALAALALGQAAPVVLGTLLLWVPAWIVAQVLRRTVSLAWALKAAVAIGLAVVLGVYLVHGDPAPWWHQVLQPMVDSAVKRSGLKGDPAQILAEASRLMTGVAAAALVLGLLVCLLLARWWQAMLYNPGGFREEFHGLRVDRTSGWASVGVLLTAELARGTLAAVAAQLAVVLMVMYLLAGLALVHALVTRLRAHAGWLVGMYLALLILPAQAGVLLAAAGLLDGWLNFRARLPAP